MKMIAIVKSDKDVEYPFYKLEEIPEGTSPSSVVNLYKEEDGLDSDATFFYVHPVFGSILQATNMPEVHHEAEGSMLSDVMYEICRSMEVDESFSKTNDEVDLAMKVFKRSNIARAFIGE